MTVRADGTSHREARSRQEPGGRPLRRDAERTRRRILAAAAEVFTGQGLDASLDEVARAAGVGVGTVYRRFPDKESLIRELFRDRVGALVTAAEEACGASDPWQGIVSFLEFTGAALADDLGLRQLMMFGTYDRDQVCYVRDQMRPVVTKLVERAQASGDLRPDFRAPDVKMIGFMLASIAEYAASATPGIWRRYLTMLLDGLRPARDGVTELPVPAPTEVDLAELMTAHGRRLAPRR
ncbi:MAG TPA: helix-turn-helix domain-containing protein [Trebonia sp.]|nr:helix-turn-helix domain-containing protein [Trebonia sp.]